MKRIILTGGGTAGHVTPNIALIPRLKELGYDIHYIGSYNGIERDLMTQLGIPYYGISTGKFRRYRSVKNLSDPFRVIKGISDSARIIKLLKPDIIFSKGGFVSVPVVLAARSRRVPVIIHESDITPGLANRLSMPSATRICCNFPETVSHLPKNKALLTGTPIRQELLCGDKYKALDILSLSDDKPVLLVIGGSQGAACINAAVRNSLPQLLPDFHVVHLCGKGKLDSSLTSTKSYKQFEYVKEDLKHFFALSDVVISRAGANAICELLALRKPHLLIPLSANASRGDQILNARSFQHQGFSMVLEEEKLTPESLISSVRSLYAQKSEYISAMQKSAMQNSIDIISELIEDMVLK